MSAALQLVRERLLDTREPEDVLAFHFAQEAHLVEELRNVRRRIAEQRARYAAKHRLRVFPSLDTLRRLFR